MKLITDGVVLAELLRSPTGPVGRDMMARGERVKILARQLAPHDTGCLESSIVKRFEENAEYGFAVRIFSDTKPCSPEGKSYSLFVHEGTDPHVILPKNAKALRFEVGGEVIYAAQVNHPGTKAQPFLRDALPAAA